MDLTVQHCRDLMAESVDRPIWMLGCETRIPRPGPMQTLSAPRGIRRFTPEEMTLVCGAGTEVDEMAEVLAEKGQYVNLPIRHSGSGTVGGALALGEGDVKRLGRGSVRDVLLQAVIVDGTGRIVTAGGPTVKNVSGFDLCRLLVGSCGRLGLIAEVIVRTRPVPLASCWYRIPDADRTTVSVVMNRVRRPVSVLWSGSEVLLCLEGHPSDLSEIRADLHRELGRPVDETDEPDLSQFVHRWLCSPMEIDPVVNASFGDCIAEIGTGVIHHRRPPERSDSVPAITEIEQRLFESFDPWQRLNGGPDVWSPRFERRVRQ